MKKKVIYLFDKKEDEILLNGKTLFTSFLETPKENFEMGLLRKKILDYDGALLFLNKCLQQDIKFQKAYDLKIFLFFDLNQYENAILNFFKSSLIDIEIYKITPPRIYNLLYDYFPSCNKSKLGKIKGYMKLYQNILGELKTSNEFAEKLISQGKFEIDNESNSYCNEYLFLNLIETKPSANTS